MRVWYNVRSSCPAVSLAVFSPAKISCDYCYYLRVRFHQLASPPGFHVTHLLKGNLVYIYKNVFFSPFGIFFSPGRGSFLVLSAPWHTGSPPGPHTQVWVLAKVCGTSSGGSKWHVRSGRHSEHVGPSRPMQTHVHTTVRYSSCR